MPEADTTYQHEATQLTVGDLRAALEGVADDMPVLLAFADEPGGFTCDEQVLVAIHPTTQIHSGADPREQLSLDGDFPTGTYSLRKHFLGAGVVASEAEDLHEDRSMTATEAEDLDDDRSMTLVTLIAALQALRDIEVPDLNAMDHDEVVIRIDLGPDQDFTVSGVHVEDRSDYDQDSIVVITAGPHWTAPT